MQNKKATKIITYLILSGLTGLAYMSLLYIMDSVAKAPPAVSVTAAYTTAMIFYFIVNKLLVFKSMEYSKSGRELFMFILIAATNYFLTQLIVHIVHQLTGEVYSGSIIAGAITITLTFFVFDRMIFKNRKKT